MRTAGGVGGGLAILIPIVLLSAALRAGPPRTALTLHVIVSGFPTDQGDAGLALWNGPAGFPEGISHAIATTYVPIRNRMASATFEGLTPGVYALTVYQDSNGNRKFDKNWLGMPKEAWGVSNDARPHLRAPRFDEAEVNLSGTETIEIHVH
jgi:uncharacterized protein (DUF2141 family)